MTLLGRCLQKTKMILGSSIARDNCPRGINTMYNAIAHSPVRLHWQTLGLSTSRYESELFRIGNLVDAQRRDAQRAKHGQPTHRVIALTWHQADALERQPRARKRVEDKQWPAAFLRTLAPLSIGKQTHHWLVPESNKPNRAETRNFTT